MIKEREGMKKKMAEPGLYPFRIVVVINQQMEIIIESISVQPV